MSGLNDACCQLSRNRRANDRSNFGWPGTRTKYLYDADGRRVQKTETANGRVLDSMYSEAGKLMFQWDPGTQSATDYIYLGDSLVSRVVSNGPVYTPLTLSMNRSVVNATSAGVNITVNISDPSAAGRITFTDENNAPVGSASVSNGQARGILTGLSYGIHVITASYSGDGTYGPQTVTFTINVKNLNWLPAVLNLLLQ